MILLWRVCEQAVQLDRSIFWLVLNLLIWKKIAAALFFLKPNINFHIFGLIDPLALFTFYLTPVQEQQHCGLLKASHMNIILLIFILINAMDMNSYSSFINDCILSLLLSSQCLVWLLILLFYLPLFFRHVYEIGKLPRLRTNDPHVSLIHQLCFID